MNMVAVGRRVTLKLASLAMMANELQLVKSFCGGFAAETSQLVIKTIWSMAVAQHKFYVENKQAKASVPQSRDNVWALPVAPDLSKSCSSLSATASMSSSSVSNVSRCGSTQSLSICSRHNSVESIQSGGSNQAQVEMLMAALRAKKEALEAKLQEKLDELKKLCLRVGELTGSLPPEYPLAPGEKAPVVRRRVGTSFAFSSDLLLKIKCKDQDALELEYEIQKRILSASHKLANDMKAKKSVRKQRRHSYQLAKIRLQELEERLRCIRSGKPLETSASTSTLPSSFLMTKKKKSLSHLLGGKSESSPAFGSLMKKRSKPDLTLAEWKEPKKETVELSHMPHSPRIYRPRSQSQSDLDEGVGVPKAERRSHTPPPKIENGKDILSGLAQNDLAVLGTRHRQMSPVIPPNCVYNQRPIARRSQHQANSNSHFNYDNDLAQRAENYDLDGLERSGIHHLPRQRTSLAHQSLERLNPPYDHTSRYASLDTRKYNTGGKRMEAKSAECLDALDGDEDKTLEEDEEDERQALRNASLGFCGTDVIDGSQLYPPMAMFRSTSTASTVENSSSHHMMNVTADALPAFYGTSLYKNGAMQRSQSASTTINDGIGARRTSNGLPPRIINGIENLNLGNHHASARVHPPHSLANFQPPTAASSRVVFSRTLPRYSTCSKVVQSSADVVKSVAREKRWYETSLDAPPAHQVKDEDLDMDATMSRVLAVPFQSDRADDFQKVPCEFPRNQTAISAGRWLPVKVTTKRFEMSDCYKYSTKYRKPPALNPCAVAEGKNGGSGPSSPSPSVRSDSSTGHQHLSHGYHHHQKPPSQSPQISPVVHAQRQVLVTMTAVGSPNNSFNFDMPESQAEAFQQEMLAWVNQAKTKPQQSRPATLV
ncbi:unnamed protein product [Notodromas monacha]|uniref:Cytohesin Ubiquitin Protein Inducing domain-containing protein n=1 Tax=Notodromas monacha TaxID=399045 RepID=A0A7R9BKS1_9CRUS|nr:unnamed protein product [Notodromas monacha]CAG0916464.1 unnamed protein product [Notodromas monacha]